MEIVKQLLVVLHIVGFGVVLGATFSQLPAAKRGVGRITTGLIHGLTTMFITGLVIVGLKYALSEPVDNAKITIKMLVLVTMIITMLVNRKKQNVSPAVFGTIAGLAILNVAFAVMWH